MIININCCSFAGTKAPVGTTTFASDKCMQPLVSFLVDCTQSIENRSELN